MEKQIEEIKEAWEKEKATLEEEKEKLSKKCKEIQDQIKVRKEQKEKAE